MNDVEKMLYVLHNTHVKTSEICKKLNVSSGYIGDIKYSRINPYRVRWCVVNGIAKFYKGGLNNDKVQPRATENSQQDSKESKADYQQGKKE